MESVWESNRYKEYSEKVLNIYNLNFGKNRRERMK